LSKKGWLASDAAMAASKKAMAARLKNKDSILLFFPVGSKERESFTETKY
jgi:hypothetical protein